MPPWMCVPMDVSVHTFEAMFVHGYGMNDNTYSVHMCATYTCACLCVYIRVPTQRSGEGERNAKRLKQA